MGTPDEPINDRKGCGTIMRIAPCAVLYPGNSSFEWAAYCGAVTHGHRTGWTAGAAFAEILERVIDGESLEEAIRDTSGTVFEVEGQDEVNDVLTRVFDLRDADDMTLEARIASIGQGWVAEETLGIALTCALEYPDDFSAAVLAAVNIEGDSDSTGSVTGALMGGLLGVEAIPEKWVDNVEDSARLRRLGGELYSAWEARVEVA